MRFHYKRLGPAIRSAGASVLPMKSMLKSKMFCESRWGWSYKRNFSALCLCMPSSPAVIKSAKKAKSYFWSLSVCDLYSDLVPLKSFFSLFFYLHCTRGRHCLWFTNFLCGQYILNSNLSERIALLTCLQRSDAFGRSLIVLTICKWINGNFCQKLWIIWLLLILLSSLYG